MQNVSGSFYDFVSERLHGTSRSELVGPPDEWGGRAIVHWANQLAHAPGFDADALQCIEVADVIDRIYGRTTDSPRARQNAARDVDASTESASSS
jgi:hypothetical protein